MRQRATSSLLVLAASLVLGGFALTQGVSPLAGGPTGKVHLAGDILIGLGGAVILWVLFTLEPAWPLSLGLAAEIFNSHWNLIPAPLPLDRILVAVGLISLLLRARGIDDILGGRSQAIHWILGLLALFAVSSALLSGSFDDPQARFELLDRFGLIPFILFAVAPAAFRTREQRRVLLGVLTATGAYLAYTSILGHIGPRSLVWPSYIVNDAIGIHSDRARGPFVEAGADGLALFECGVAAAVLAFDTRDRWLRRACVAIVIACAVSIELTLTRSIWIGSGVAIAVAMLAARETRKYFVPAVFAGLVLVFAILALVPGFASDASDRENDKRPIWDRKNANGAALRMVEERPLLGFGWDSFATENTSYQRIAATYPITLAQLSEHNVFLSNAVEVGLPATLLWAGTLLAVLLVGAFSRRGPPELRPWRIGMVAIGVQWLVVANFVPLAYAFPNALIWLWAGILWRAGRDMGEVQPVEPEVGAEAAIAAASAEVTAPRAPIACAYVVARYPYVTHTFVQREVLALRDRGADIRTVTVRRTEPELVVSDTDRAEERSTFAILPVRIAGLVRSHLRAARFSLSAYRRTLVETLRDAPRNPRALAWQLFYFGEAMVMWDYLRRGGLRHVHAHHANVAADLAMIATRFANRGEGRDAWRWTMTVHGPDDFTDAEGRKLALKAIRADAVIAISEYAAEQLRKITAPATPAPIEIVKCGIDVEAYSPTEREPPSEQLRVLNVAQLAPRKGQRILLDAIRMLRRDGIAATLTIVGEGPEREDLEDSITTYGLDDAVVMKGAMSPTDVQALYERADVFCLPSYAEGVPIVLMEAMASGVPSIGTRVAGVPELIEDGVSGLLVEPGSPEQLAEALRRIHEDSDLADRLAEAGRQAVIDGFTIGAAADRLERIFAEVEHRTEPEGIPA
jgi:glycosyltransferase involved in cell wall biosynthesis/O-antigen ligase